MLEQAEARLRWAKWAADQVEAWPDAATGNPEAPLNNLRSTLQTPEQEDRSRSPNQQTARQGSFQNTGPTER